MAMDKKREAHITEKNRNEKKGKVKSLIFHSGCYGALTETFLPHT